MSKPLIFVLLLLTGVVGGGLYGALHNQLSFSIGPTYFLEVKFTQFNINRDLPPRLGAAQVGWLASWWMGLAIAVPAALTGWLRIAKPQTFLAAGLGALGLALCCAIAGACLGLAYGFITDINGLVARLPNPDALSNPESFMRAGLMHNGSYYGGAIGGLLALVTMWRAGGAAGPIKP